MIIIFANVLHSQNSRKLIANILRRTVITEPECEATNFDTKVTKCLCIYISCYHGKRGISLWVIRYIPQFELAVTHLGINHYCSLSLLLTITPYTQYKLGLVWELFGWDGIYISWYHSQVSCTTLESGITTTYILNCLLGGRTWFSLLLEGFEHVRLAIVQGRLRKRLAKKTVNTATAGKS